MVPAPDVPPRTPRAGDERTLLCAQLDDKQTILLRKVAGLSEDDLRRTPTASAIHSWSTLTCPRTFAESRSRT